jgi:hypothetical protein
MRHFSLTVHICVAFAGLARAADDAPGIPHFRVQEIDKTLKVGYGVKLVDLNGDGKLDIVVADSARVIWFENPTWKLHTILEDSKAGIKADNVCIDAYDVNGDGKPELVLGADWQPGNTKGGGSLYWLSRPKNPDDMWTAHQIIVSEPTLHRAHFGDLDGDGRAELIVGPLKGRDSTQQANFTDVGSRLLAFHIPKNPGADKWEPMVLTDQLHVLHNFLPVRMSGHEAAPSNPGDKKPAQVLTASYEGVTLVAMSTDGKSTLTHIGEGDQANPKASRGSSEIKLGRLGGATLLATIEPFHGNQVVVYLPPKSADASSDQKLWTRVVLDDKLNEGHGLWCADLDGDGNDEVIAGWRGGNKTGLRIYKATPASNQTGGFSWTPHDLDPGGVACEDLACADLNGDGRIDIVAVGRKTGNVRIYWNER